MHQEISNRFWDSIKRHAEKRGILFLITPIEAWQIFLVQNRKCIYTGVLLDFKSHGYRGNASLDRIESHKPYVSHNVQWVLNSINIMKGSHNSTHFQYLCQLVVENMTRHNIVSSH
jgi:hypothetical protein